MDLKIYVLRITTTVAFLRLFLPSVINDRATTASSQTAGNTLWTLRWLWGGFSRTRTASLKEKHLCRAGGWFPLYNRSCLGSGNIKSIKPNQCRKSVQASGPFFGQWRDQNHTNGFVNQEFDWMMFEKKVGADAKNISYLVVGHLEFWWASRVACQCISQPHRYLLYSVLLNWRHVSTIQQDYIFA